MKKPQAFFQNPPYLLALIVLLALILRAAYVSVAPRVDPILRNNPLHGDAAGYVALAEHLVAGDGLTFDGQSLTAFRLPGYPLFLAGIFSLFSYGQEAARLIQALLSALTCVPIFLLARRLVGDKWALLAGLGVALHPILIYMSGWLYSETLYIFLFWFALLFLVRALSDDLFSWGALAGAFFGLASLVRPEAITFLLFVLIGGLLMRWRRRFAVAAVAQLVVLAVLAPWIVRNFITQDALVLATTSTGVTLHDANNELAYGGSYHEGEWILSGYSETESSAEFTGRALDWIRGNPGKFLALLPAKLYKFFSPVELDSTPESPLGALALPVNLLYFVFLLLAAWGAVSTRQSVETQILVLLILQYVLLALVFHGSTRVALPLSPAYVLLAVAGLKNLVNRKIATSPSPL